MSMLKFKLLLSFAVSNVAGGDTTTIFKVDYPEKGSCGLERNVSKSRLNPHWVFPMVFGGFSEGTCADVGYSRYEKTETVAMHPVPGVHHNLTFEIYGPTQTRTTDVSLKDPARPSRDVKFKLCMPLNNGADPRTHPLLIFGHGAGCDAEDYQYFCQKFATAMIYQDSPAGAIFPADFDVAAEALDAKFLAKQLIEISRSDTGSPLYKKLDGQVIIGGHSMGGGMAVLSAGMDSASVSGLAMFAPGLYTKPDGTPYLKNITVPALVVSGSMDCGQNALDKQAQPAFDGLSSKTKVLVVLKGANHCQWIQPFEKVFGVCSMMKNECHGISRSEQHSLGTSLAYNFSLALQGNEQWDEFEKQLARGEADGVWTYFSSKTSPQGKHLHNDCPCDHSTDSKMENVGNVTFV